MVVTGARRKARTDLCEKLVFGMTARIDFRGPPRYRLRSVAELNRTILEVCARRTVKGPRLPKWGWFVELATEVLKRQTLVAFQMRDVNEARLYLDSVMFASPALSEVSITPVVQENLKGSWYTLKSVADQHVAVEKLAAQKLASNKHDQRVTLLYCHGGGYSFYPRAYSNFIALITLAARSKTFALDYRLTPEHRFPAQLEDALHAYRWLLGTGVDPESLIVAGDSAGGNLTLALLQKIRESNLSPPALAIALSPPTDFEAELMETLPGGHSSGPLNMDWIDKQMVEQWSKWFCDAAESRNPLISPLWADLRGLPPIYIQAGRVEILYPSIQAFAEHARQQGADIVLESWEDMTHDFQLFGPDAPQS